MSKSLSPNDPCRFMLHDGFTTEPKVYQPGCHICEDPEFAQMGLPLCYPCKFCRGHVAADGDVCDKCGKDQNNDANDHKCLICNLPLADLCLVKHPTLKYCIAALQVKIEQLQTELDNIKKKKKEKIIDRVVCATCDFWEPEDTSRGFCPKQRETTDADSWCIHHEPKCCEYCGHYPCGCGG